MSVGSCTSQSIRYKPTVAPLAIEEESEIFEEKDAIHLEGDAHQKTAAAGGYVYVDSSGAQMDRGVAPLSGGDDVSGGLAPAGSDMLLSGGSLNNWYCAATPTINRHRNDSLNCSQGTRKSSCTSQVRTTPSQWFTLSPLAPTTLPKPQNFKNKSSFWRNCKPFMLLKR